MTAPIPCPVDGVPFVPEKHGGQRRKTCSNRCKKTAERLARKYGQFLLATGAVTIPYLIAWEARQAAEASRAAGKPDSGGDRGSEAA